MDIEQIRKERAEIDNEVIEHWLRRFGPGIRKKLVRRQTFSHCMALLDSTDIDANKISQFHADKLELRLKNLGFTVEFTGGALGTRDAYVEMKVELDPYVRKETGK